jgi:chemotaxis protein CheD
MTPAATRPPDPARDRTVTVLQGDLHVSSDPTEVLSTILGSCVAVCLWDPMARVGGMNHFLLPGDNDRCANTIKYGTHAMELLINALMRKGAVRGRLQAKLFGGAQMVSQFRTIGASNIRFARAFLQTEGIPCLSESLGGTTARRVRFWPTTGQAQMLAVPRHDSLPVTLTPAVTAPLDITLF